jgi:hypothetical protein
MIGHRISVPVLKDCALPGLIDLLTTDQIVEINKYHDKARGRHPAWSVINAFDQAVDYPRSPKDFLANAAVDRIGLGAEGKPWLTSTLKRVAQTSDFEESVSSIAEICCYGAMLEAGFDIRPIPTVKNAPTPGFEFDLDGASGIVEVTAKLEHDEQVKRARKIAGGETPDGVERSVFGIQGGSVGFTASVSHPFGAPDAEKAGDTTQTNAISRICQIKAKETQFADGKPSLLWIDFRDLGKWPGGFKEEQSSPLISGHHGALCSGAIWYAFYGWKGAPVFDDHAGGGYTITPMAHEGRFSAQAAKTSRYAAAILCLEEATILLENPRAPTPLSKAQRGALTLLPWFNIHYSVAEWEEGDVDRSHALARSMIEAIRASREDQ